MDIKISLTKRGWIAVILGVFLALILIVFAYFFGLLALILGFITMVINLVWAFLVWLAAQLGLTALITWIVTQISALFAWFATTWLGSLLMPLYTWVAPIVAKFGPAVTMGRWTRDLWKNFTSLRGKSKAQLHQAEQIIEHQDTPEEPKR